MRIINSCRLSTAPFKLSLRVMNVENHRIISKDEIHTNNIDLIISHQFKFAPLLVVCLIMALTGYISTT